VFLYGALVLLLISGMIFTRSRAGITLTILAILAATSTFDRRIGGNNVYGVPGTIITFVFASINNHGRRSRDHFFSRLGWNSRLFPGKEHRKARERKRRAECVPGRTQDERGPPKAMAVA